MQKEKIAFIINPVSGNKNKDRLPSLINKLLDKNKFSAEIFMSERAGHATSIAKKMVNEGFDCVVAVGGDGTVNEVAQGLIHSSVVLGIIPAGSGNGLARHLQIPLVLKKSMDIINKGKEIEIDYGKANDKIFFCTCGTGFDAHISEQFAQADSRGLQTYVKKTITEFFKYQPQHYHLKNDDIDLEQEAFLITFANASQYGNNAYIAPKANLQDGLMDISILSKFPLHAVPKLAISLFSKKIHKSYYMTTLRTDKIVLYRKEAGSFHFDGEASETGEIIEVKMIKSGLKVRVEKNYY